MGSQTGTRSLTLERLPFRDAYPFIEKMMHAHSKESLGRKAVPDYAGFCSLCDAGRLRSYVMMNDGVAVGYCVMYLSNNLIHSDIDQAIQIAAYVKPAFRTGCGRWMIRKVDVDLRSHVDRIYRHERPESGVGRVYESLGYKLDEHTYVLD